MRRLLNWLLYAQTGGQFRELVGLSTHFAPPDVSAYRRYLPASLDMPRHPVVKVFLIDYLKVSPWPFTRYQEWSVLLRAAHHGEEGWYPVTMPVTTWIARQGGHHLGFPKYMADSIELVDANGAIEGRAYAAGRLDVTMTFREGRVPSVPAWERSSVEEVRLFPDNLVTLKPVGVGPDVRWVRFEEVATSSWDVQRGMVTIQGDAGGLLVQDRPLAASVHRFRGGMNLVPLDLDTVPMPPSAPVLVALPASGADVTSAW